MDNKSRIIVLAFVGFSIVCLLAMSVYNIDRIQTEPLTFFCPIFIAFFLAGIFDKNLLKKDN